jgi:hypothetical protein
LDIKGIRRASAAAHHASSGPKIIMNEPSEPADFYTPQLDAPFS